MKHSPTTSRETKACEWLTKIREGKIHTGSDVEFRQWIADDLNKRCLEDLELAWTLAAEVHDSPAIQSLLEGLDAAPRSRKGFMRAMRLRPRRMVFAAAMVLLIGLGAITIPAWLGRPVAIQYATAIGQQRMVTLADGSVMTLNTATQVSVIYSRTTRRIKLLSGEAVFEVQKTPQRPFVVDALQGAVQATGTEFDVQIKADAAQVLVLEGTVRVQLTPESREGHGVTVIAGQAVEYHDNGSFTPLPSPNADRIRAWQAHRLVFDDSSLADAVDEYNRYVPVPVILADDQLRSLRIHGTFKTGDEVAFLAALEQGLQVKLERTTTAVVVHAKSGSRPL